MKVFNFNPLIPIIVIATMLLVIIRYWLKKIEEKAGVSGELVEWLKDLGQRLEQSTQVVDQKLSQNMQQFNSRLDNAATVIGRVQKSIGEFSEIGRSMKQLQEFLQSPKLRGNIGEQILRELLIQCLPPDLYSLQYAFQSGDKVDAVVKTSQGLIPIDSKFPIDNFRKMYEGQTDKDKEQYRKDFRGDVKKHITDIAQKYIMPSEGTMDYALMYIPSEAVYYEIINNADLYDFASQKRVIPVSPLSFYAYLKAILVSLEGLRIQSQAKEVLMLLQAIKKDYEKSDDSLNTLIKHLTNAYNQSNFLSKNFNALGQKIHSTQLLSAKPVKEKLIEQ